MKVRKKAEIVSGIEIKKVSIWKTVWRCRTYYLFLLPALLFVIIFEYIPMPGILIAFQRYRVTQGILGSRWVGFQNFIDYFSSYLFWDLLRNTLRLSLYSLVVGFPVPIIVALILNEMKPKFKRISQTILYAPHFISTVVLVGMMFVVFSPSTGVFNMLLNKLGIESMYLMGEAKYFSHMFVWSGVWQSMGWSAIIYIAALAGVDPSLHEAAEIDGASRMQRIVYINIPLILPTIMIRLILRMGHLASVGYEKIYLMQTELNLDVSEVISTYVYKRGILNTNYSFSTAVGLFNNVVNIILLLMANKVSKKLTQTGLF